MFLFSFIVQFIIDDLEGICDLYLSVWCADDGTLVAPISKLLKDTSTLQDFSITLRYHL